MRTDFCSCGIYLNKTSIEGAALPFGALRKLNINTMNHFSSRLLAPDSESSILPLMESHCFRHKKNHFTGTKFSNLLVFLVPSENLQMMVWLQSNLAILY